jgi:hypothetical protein
MKNLLIPVAGESSRYPNMRPKWLLTMPNGLLMIEKSISKIECKFFDKIYIIALKEHIDNFCDKKLLLKSLKKNISTKIEIVELKKKTSCQAETILHFLMLKKIKGSFLIKDCDNEFSIDKKYISSKLIKNLVCAININEIELLDAKNKSYIQIDKLSNVTNIVEKEIISNFFCCGAYGFQDVESFILHAKELLKKSKNIFISHVILKMLFSGINFKYVKASEYSDWGTLKDFRIWQSKYLTIFCDFDGCLVENGSKFTNGWKTPLIEKNISSLKKLQTTNYVKLIITTSRPSSELKKIKRILKNNNVEFHKIITDLPHSKRILINDFSSTNPYPSAVSINIERNSRELSNIFLNLM